MLVITLGGALGGLARYGLDEIAPTASGSFPWTTLVINVFGSAALAALLAAGVRVWRHPLDVLFVGTGLLGGFTTFSTYAVQSDRLLAGGHAGVGLTYLLVTVVRGRCCSCRAYTGAAGR